MYEILVSYVRDSFRSISASSTVRSEIIQIFRNSNTRRYINRNGDFLKSIPLEKVTKCALQIVANNRELFLPSLECYDLLMIMKFVSEFAGQLGTELKVENDDQIYNDSNLKTIELEFLNIAKLIAKEERIIPDFSGIATAIYHFNKHRRCDCLTNIMSLNEYYNLIRSQLVEIKKFSHYSDFINPKKKFKCLLFDKF